ncbi:MAG: HAD-IA family hydrolase [Candidatus Kapabacteria bacterium]|nr:HAD-IA family hydrolase [Candidatus Kapabacteria bacterium]
MSVQHSVVTAIYFDVDNTLLDHSSAELQAFATTCEQFHLTAQYGVGKSATDLFATYNAVNLALWERFRAGDLTAAEVKLQRFEKFLLKEFDFGKAYSIQLAEDMSSYYLESYEHFWTLTDGAEELIDAARNTAATIGIITNGFVEQQHRKLRRFGWDTLFDVILISDEVGYPKPHPQMYAIASERAGIAEPHHALMIGDHYSADITGAKNAGWQTIWFQPDGIARDAENGYSDADSIVESLHDAVALLND